VALGGNSRLAYRFLVGKPEESRELGKHRRRWKITLKLLFKKWDGGTDWLDLAQNRDIMQAFVNVVMNLGVL
jgi:hypothetical protein